MAPVDLKELTPLHHDLRERRLRRLRDSVAAQNYDVSSALIAQGIIREAFIDAICRHAPSKK